MASILTRVVLLQREDLTGYPMLQLVVQEVGADWWAKVVHGQPRAKSAPAMRRERRGSPNKTRRNWSHWRRGLITQTSTT